MSTNNKVLNAAAYSILFINFYSISILPFSTIVFESIFFIQSLIVVVLVSVKFDFQNFLKSSPGKLDFLKILFFILSITILLSFIYNINTSNLLSFFKLASYFYLTYIFSFCFADSIVKNDIRFENFISVILIFVVVNTMVALTLRMFDISFNSNYLNQSLGLFGHPNTLGMLYVIGFPVLIYKFFAKQIRFELFFVIVILFLYSLMFTFSRASYIGVGAGILIFTFFKSKKIFLFTALITVLILIYFVIDIASTKTDSSIARILLALTAVDMIFRDTSSILWGYGVYNSLELFMNEKIYFGNYESVLDPHNIILLLGMQFGLVATFLVLLICIILPFKVIFKRKKFNEADSLKIILCFTVITSLMINNMLEDILFYPEFFIFPVFLTFIGVLLSYNSTLKNYRIQSHLT